MQKAVIFDLDGTILDTLQDIAENVNLTLEKFGYQKRTNQEIRRFIGCGARRLVELAFGDNVSDSETDKRLEYYNKIYTASSSAKTCLFDNMKEVLLTLKSRGYKLAILTNKPQKTTDRVCKEHLSDIAFDKIVGQSESIACKPDKTATLNILRELNVDNANAYFVGDGETDVLTAINSNTNGIAVLWGYRDKEQLEQVGAKVFATSPIDLLTLIP